LGEWEFCSLLWSFLKEKNVIKQETFASKEVLYRMDLQKLAFPRQKDVRLLQAGDFLQWKRLTKDYINELGLVGDLNDEQLHVRYLRNVQKKMGWGLFLNGELVSLADLNAQAFDLGQVGGVYTVPAFRNRGYSKAVMKQLAWDAKNVLLLRKLLIFTDVGNQPARSVYESLEVEQAGFYAIFFGSR
jgi:predicted GNAT family acetyltransferase